MNGYTHCACQDCFELLISDDPPAYCDGCSEAGCEDIKYGCQAILENREICSSDCVVCLLGG